MHKESAKPRTPSSGRPRTRWPARIVSLCCWIDLISLIAVWFIIHFLGERWWIATMLLFTARWPWGLPFLILIPLVLRFHRKSLLVLAIASLFFVAILNPRLHLPAAKANTPTIRIATWNIHWGIRLNTHDAQAWFANSNFDVIAFEEWAPAPELRGVFPSDLFTIDDGELHLLSRYPIERFRDHRLIWDRSLPGASAAYLIHAPFGDIPCAVVHLASPHIQIKSVLRGNTNGADELMWNSRCRRQQAAVVGNWLQSAGSLAIVAGDFNTPDDSPIFRQLTDHAADAFDRGGNGFGWTYRYLGALARIDHVLAASGWRIRQCEVGPDFGSPHRPLFTELQIKSPMTN